jgi:hypothetical protein
LSNNIFLHEDQKSPNINCICTVNVNKLRHIPPWVAILWCTLGYDYFLDLGWCTNWAATNSIRIHFWLILIDEKYRIQIRVLRLATTINGKGCCIFHIISRDKLHLFFVGCMFSHRPYAWFLGNRIQSNLNSPWDPKQVWRQRTL